MSTPSQQWSRRDFVRAGLALAAAPVLASCKASTEPATPHLTSRPGTPSITPVRGVSVLGLEADRDGIMYVPATYDPTVPAALFVALHGAGGTGYGWSSYYPRAEQRQMIVLAPTARAQTWDIVRGQLGPDVSYIDRALAHTFARCRIDPRRICLGGFSDGASYALALGLANGDLFTHLASYSPGFLAQPDPLVGKPKVFISHGTSDPVLSFNTSQNVIAPQLRSEGYDVTFQQFDGVHEVPPAISEAALDWFYGKTPG
ncbi:MAG: phospholipase [Gemmatimonadaceae bacterium]